MKRRKHWPAWFFRLLRLNRRSNSNTVVKPFRVKITESMLRKAKRREKNAGESYKGSVLDRRFHGFLAEEIVYAIVPRLLRDNNSDHDFRYEDYTFDVKAKTWPSKPKPYFVHDVLEISQHQKTTFYIFVSIEAPRNICKRSMKRVLNYPYKRAWIMGFMSKKTFLKKAKFCEKGQRDHRRKTFRFNSYTVRYSQLICIKKMIRAISLHGQGLNLEKVDPMLVKNGFRSEDEFREWLRQAYEDFEFDDVA